MKQKVIGNIKKDKLLRKCESLMLRGVDAPSDISRELKIAYNTAKSYVLIVKERWSDSKSIEELELKREELIRKTEEIIKESWRLKDGARNTLEAVGALRTALQAIERLQKLQGLDNLPHNAGKHRETEIYEYAQAVNVLPAKSRNIILTAVRQAKKIKENESRTAFTSGL